MSRPMPSNEYDLSDKWPRHIRELLNEVPQPAQYFDGFEMWEITLILEDMVERQHRTEEFRIGFPLTRL